MKTTFNNSELAHIWASRSQAYGKGSNMFFEDGVIYSYGRHFPIARFVDTPNGVVVLVNSNSYSISTSKHQSYVNRAITHQTVFAVPDASTSHLKNIEYFVGQYTQGIGDALNSRTKSEYILIGVEVMRERLQNYMRLFGLKQKDFVKVVLNLAKVLKDTYLSKADRNELTKRIETQRERAELREQRQHAAIALGLQKLRNEVPAWLAGEYIPNISNLPEVYLREREGVVETSHGARVKVESAKVLFQMIQRGDEVRGHMIDNYQVIGLNGVLTIGCHKIERDEITRFATLMGW